MFLTLIIFLIILGTLVLVHELGHFVVARRNGVVAEEFGFGFPPRVVGVYRDKDKRWRWVFGSKEIEKEIKEKDETVYSINLIPLGGFVKIKGEDGQEKDAVDSFASQSVWKRFKILVAGVLMNFILGIVLLSGAFWIGLPEVVDDSTSGKIQVAEVVADSPAKDAGMTIGDEIVAVVINGTEIKISSINEFQEITKANAGKEMFIRVLHPGDKETVVLNAVPRETPPEGQGLLGISLVKTDFVSHGFFESVKLATQAAFGLVQAILYFLGDLIARLVTAKPVSTEVAGPVGIAVMTGQVARLGLAYVLQFAAMLSINLAVINIFPFPALDGGRIIFLLVEKLKGSPVSQKVEGIVHTAGFLFLLGVMFLVTVRDVMNFDIVDKIMNIF